MVVGDSPQSNQRWDHKAKRQPSPAFVFIYLASPDLSCSTGDLVPWPWTRLRPPALGAQSLSHWPTREVPALQCPWLDNPTDRGPRRATVHGLTESDTTERYADYKCMHGWQSHSKHKMGSWILINTMLLNAFFTCLIFYPHIGPYVVLFSFYGWAKWGLQMLSNFPKATYWEDRPQPNCDLKVCLNFNIVLLQGPSLLPVINVVIMLFMKPSQIHTIYKPKLSSPQYSEPSIYFAPLWLYPFNHLHFFFALGIVIPDAISKGASFFRE